MFFDPGTNPLSGGHSGFQPGPPPPPEPAPPPSHSPPPPSPVPSPNASHAAKFNPKLVSLNKVKWDITLTPDASVRYAQLILRPSPIRLEAAAKDLVPKLRLYS